MGRVTKKAMDALVKSKLHKIVTFAELDEAVGNLFSSKLHGLVDSEADDDFKDYLMVVHDKDGKLYTFDFFFLPTLHYNRIYVTEVHTSIFK